jgi:hypothetical protein
MRRRPLELQLQKSYAPKIPLDSADRPARLEFVSNFQTKYISLRIVAQPQAVDPNRSFEIA